MTLQLIDDQGQMWDGGSRQLRRAYDSPYSGGEFSDYAVMNLGFIAVNIYGSSAQIRIRPTFATDRAIDSLYRWLLPRSFERFVISWHGDGWRDELFRFKKDAVERLDQLIDEAKRERPAEYLAVGLTATDLREDEQIAPLIRHWRAAVAEGSDAQRQLLSTVLGNRYIVLRHDRAIGRLVFKEIGEGLFRHSDKWRMCAVGAPVEELPDRCYGKWAAESYKQALRNPFLCVAAVDAFVRWPEVGRVRMRYKRLIAPLNSRSGDLLLLGGSLLDDRIDLRRQHK